MAGVADDGAAPDHDRHTSRTAMCPSGTYVESPLFSTQDGVGGGGGKHLLEGYVCGVDYLSSKTIDYIQAEELMNMRIAVVDRLTL